MKTYKVKPAEVIGLEFEDGKTIALKFNTRAMSYLGEIMEGKKITPADLAYFYAAVIYAGAKVCDPDFTFEEAENLYVQLQEMQPGALEGILQEYYSSAGIDINDFVKKNLTRIYREAEAMKEES